MTVRCVHCRKYAERITKLKGHCPNCGTFNSLIRVSAQGIKHAARKKGQRKDE